eukprot:6829599-Prymnesium_polylepis.1
MERNGSLNKSCRISKPRFCRWCWRGLTRSTTGTMQAEPSTDEMLSPLVGIVTSTLEQRGVLSKIRAQLRANVFSAIHEQQAPQEPSCAALRRLQEERAGTLATQLVHDLL